MGRPEEPLERDGSPVREFAFWLRDLRHRSALTYDQLGKKAGYATSTVQAAMAGQKPPTLRVTMAIARACDGDASRANGYWTQIRRLVDGTADSDRTVEPPWAGTGPGPGTVAAVPGDGWYVESFCALVRLDAEPVESMEFRRVAATVDGLAELVTSAAEPRQADHPGCERALDSELLYGGMLEHRARLHDPISQNVIVLPARLRAGQRHEYAMRYRMLPGQAMATHYVHVPYRRSDSFDLLVRFAADRPPREVWVLRDAPATAIYRRDPSAELLVPDPCGEVRIAFTGMRPGLGYGLSWR